MKFKTQFLLFMVLIIIIAVIEVFIIEFNDKESLELNQRLEKTSKSISLSNHLLSALKDSETGQRGYLLTQDEKYLEPYYRSKISVENYLFELEQINHKDRSQKERLSKIKALSEQKFSELQNTIFLERESLHKKALHIVKSDHGKDIMDSIRAEVAQFIELEKNTLLMHKKAYANYKQKIKIFNFIAILILMVIVIAFYLLIQKTFVYKIDKLMVWVENKQKNQLENNEIRKIFEKSNDELGILANTLFMHVCELNKNLALFKSFQKATSENNMLSKSDLHGNITYVNEEFCRVTGYTEDEVIGQPHSIVRHEDTPKELFEELWKVIKRKGTWTGIIKNKKKDGGSYWVKTVISPMLDEHNNIVEFVAIRNDITEIIEQKKQIQRSVRTDRLTSLPNRIQLFEDIEKAVLPSLAIIDIDKFREVNDFYGNRFGDKVLLEFSKLTLAFMDDQKSVSLYRLHGDEFAVLNSQMDKEQCIKFVNELVNIVSMHSFKVKKEELSVKISVSISFEKKDILFETADMAMKMAKKEEKSILIYDDNLGINKEYQNNLKWASKLQSAIKEDRLLPFFQPIVNNSNGKWEKYESLVRIIDDDGQIISPYFFLEIAKRTKNYINLTKIIMQKSFDTFHNTDIEFSINLTIQDITNNELKNFIIAKLQEYKNGQQVVFEIVESEGIDNFENVLEFIADVKQYGCKIAIDDFGTGYSNFEYLLRLKADYIKIDGSMIKNLDTDQDAKIVVETIVGFAKRMEIKTIAEFVENEKIFNIVKDLGIDYTQGYFLSKPLQEIKDENK